MVGILVSFWDGLFSGAMLVLGSVNLEPFNRKKPFIQTPDHVTKFSVTPKNRPLPHQTNMTSNRPSQQKTKQQKNDRFSSNNPRIPPKIQESHPSNQ